MCASSAPPASSSRAETRSCEALARSSRSLDSHVSVARQRLAQETPRRPSGIGRGEQLANLSSAGVIRGAERPRAVGGGQRAEAGSRFRRPQTAWVCRLLPHAEWTARFCPPPDSAGRGDHLPGLRVAAGRVARSRRPPSRGADHPAAGCGRCFTGARSAVPEAPQGGLPAGTKRAAPGRPGCERRAGTVSVPGRQ